MTPGSASAAFFVRRHDCLSRWRGGRYAYTKGAHFEAEADWKQWVRLQNDAVRSGVAEVWLRWLRGFRPGLQLPSARISDTAPSTLLPSILCRNEVQEASELLMKLSQSRRQ